MTLTLACAIFFFSSAEAKYDLKKREYDPMLATGINFTAFDCETPASNWSALDIKDIAPCKSAETDYEDVENITVSLIQTNVPRSITVIRCRLKLTRTVETFGMHSHGFGKKFIEQDDKTIWAQPAFCRRMYKARQFNCPTQLCGGMPSGLIHFPKDGVESLKQWESIGSFDEAGNAKTREIKLKSGRIVWGVQTSVLKVMVSNYTALLEMPERVVEIEPLHLRLKYDSGSHFDEERGILTWDTPAITCHERSAVIAKDATASIRRLKPEHRRKGKEHANVGAILIIEDPEENRATGMVISENKDYCSMGCHETNIESLNVCIGSDVSNMDKLVERPANRITRLNMQSQGSYLALNSQLGLYDLHYKMQTSICRLETRAIKQDFASILNVNNMYALEGMRTTDPERPLDKVFDVIVRGAVAYFSQCREEMVEVIEVENCTQQIPVRRANGELYFVDPINLKMVKFPNIKECIAGLPVQYKINGKRYCHDPRHRRCAEGTHPTMIQPASGGKARGIKVEDLPSLGDQLISPRQMEQIRELKKVHSLNHIVMDQVSHNAATATWAEDSRMGGILDIAMPLSKEDVQRLTDMVAGNMFFLFKWLGQIYLHLFGLMIVFNVAKHLFECGYRMYYIYKAFGPGFWLLKAFGATIFSVSMLPKTILEEVARGTTQSLTNWREEVVPPPDYEQYQARVAQQEEQIKNIRNALLDFIQNPNNKKDQKEIDALVSTLYPSHELRGLEINNRNLPNGPDISVLGRDQNRRRPPQDPPSDSNDGAPTMSSFSVPALRTSNTMPHDGTAEAPPAYAPPPRNPQESDLPPAILDARPPPNSSSGPRPPTLLRLPPTSGEAQYQRNQQAEQRARLGQIRGCWISEEGRSEEGVLGDDVPPDPWDYDPCESRAMRHI